jgi:hypothetical protein
MLLDLLLTCGIERKVLEDAFQEDTDDEQEEDDGKLLNMNEEDGSSCVVLKVHALTKFYPDDVWDEDSAYLELLASEVSQDVSANFVASLK